MSRVKQQQKKQDSNVTQNYVALIYYKNGLSAKWGMWSEKLEGSWQYILERLANEHYNWSRHPEKYERVVIYPS